MMAASGGSRHDGGPKKLMGIQFVKSSETQSPETSSSRSLGSNRPVPSSNPNPMPLLGMTGSSQSSRPQFGSPAAHFTPKGGSSSRQSDPLPSRYSQAFVRAGNGYSSLRDEPDSRRGGYRMPDSSNFGKRAFGGSAPIHHHDKPAEAKPLCSVEEYLRAWKDERDPFLTKLRKLAYEAVSLKSDRPNAKDKLHSAANRVPLRIEFNIQPVLGAKTTQSYLCYVFIENVAVASGQGPKRKDAKTNAYEAALQKLLMPHMRVIPTDPTSSKLQGSKEPFTSPPPEPSKVPLHNHSSDGLQEGASQHKESNLEAAGLKRRHNQYKQLDDFVIVEPKVPIPDCTAAHTLRRSADFNHMLLEYEYYFKGEAARCILRIENEVLADVNGVSKVAAKNKASAQALVYLKKFCWIIMTKQAVDSNTKISKDEIVNELNEQSDAITNDNIGNKMLRKMGWSGGGVGKEGDGIAEPVSLKSVLNREGLGLSASKGVTDDIRKRIKDVIENYAASDNQEDLVFSFDFRLEERHIIHDECRRLNLRSKSRGKGVKRYLCVRRKRSVNQLFDHLMSVGGETARYQLVPPGRGRDVGSSTSMDQSMSSSTSLLGNGRQHHHASSHRQSSQGQGDYSSNTKMAANNNGMAFQQSTSGSSNTHRSSHQENRFSRQSDSPQAHKRHRDSFNDTFRNHGSSNNYNTNRSTTSGSSSMANASSACSGGGAVGQWNTGQMLQPQQQTQHQFGGQQASWSYGNSGGGSGSQGQGQMNPYQGSSSSSGSGGGRGGQWNNAGSTGQTMQQQQLPVSQSQSDWMFGSGSGGGQNSFQVNQMNPPHQGNNSSSYSYSGGGGGSSSSSSNAAGGNYPQHAFAMDNSNGGGNTLQSGSGRGWNTEPSNSWGGHSYSYGGSSSSNSNPSHGTSSGGNQHSHHHHHHHKSHSHHGAKYHH